ncbi:hypothetical protein EDB85DRAFT_2276320 [Lactarius pseudohatsudake]|nr:hypothetical protein EDB85DRAFT_2276320 [Lactarius pseudohatsudake]
MSPYLDLPYLDVSILLVNLLSIFAGIRSQMSKVLLRVPPEDSLHRLTPVQRGQCTTLATCPTQIMNPKTFHMTFWSPVSTFSPAAPATATDRDVPGPAKLRMVVKDVAYATYRTVLDYVLLFSYLSLGFYSCFISCIWIESGLRRCQSSFLSSCSPGATCEQSANDSQASLGPVTRMGSAEVNAGASSRREWIQKWEHGNPGHPVPYSAKAVYRLADKLGLAELKSRAFEHITKSFTVENVPYEVFSTFSATFELVRKVEVKSFLDHWAEMRSSDAMRRVWHQIRLGRHPGFEEGSHVPPLCRSTPVDPYPPVWPVIATQLEFKPHNSWADFDELENDENLTPAQ